MADVTSATLQAALLHLQSRRLALVSLIMSRREQEDAPALRSSALEVFGYRLRLLVAYIRLHLAIRACEALQSGGAS